MARLAEKKKSMEAFRKAIEMERQELGKLVVKLQKGCTHEIVVDCNEIERMCYTCTFRELRNPGTNFEKLGHSLLVLPVDVARKLTSDKLDELILKQVMSAKFLRKCFGE